MAKYTFIALKNTVFMSIDISISNQCGRGFANYNTPVTLLGGSGITSVASSARDRRDGGML